MKFKKEEIDAMTIEQLEGRAAAIDATNTEGLSAADATNLAEEREYIGKKLAEKRLEAFRADMRRAKIAGLDIGGHKAPEEKREEKTYDSASPEYRSAFYKIMTGRGAELTEAETRAAYTAVTTDTTNGAAYVLPREMVNAIWDLVESNHSILGDITMYRTGTILEVPYRSAITQGDATTVSENAANDDEINTLGKVTLTGKDFSKTLHLSYAMAKMSIDAFENFLVQEISDRIGAALATDIVTQITTDYYATGNAVNSTSVKAASFKDVAGVMALLENGKGQCVIYGRRSTIYSYLVGLVDTTGRPIFQPDAQADRAGYLIGCPVKVEEAVAANKLLIGFPANVVGNLIQDIMVESARDIEKHVITYSGYARFECKLMAAKSFALYTIKQS